MNDCSLLSVSFFVDSFLYLYCLIDVISAVASVVKCGNTESEALG